MNASANEPGRGNAAPTAQALFEGERLPFPPVPAALAALLQPQGPGWFATRPVATTPYDFDHFLGEVEAQPALPDYAVVGFDGHGANSWAVHFYLVDRGLALFVQLPWGGAYVDAEPARAEIAELFDWAAAMQSRLRSAEAARRIPHGTRLQVAASRFGHAGWRWLDAGQDAAATPWNPPAGMKAAMLNELDELIAGRRTTTAAAC